MSLGCRLGWIWSWTRWTLAQTHPQLPDYVRSEPPEWCCSYPTDNIPIAVQKNQPMILKRLSLWADLQWSGASGQIGYGVCGTKMDWIRPCRDPAQSFIRKYCGQVQPEITTWVGGDGQKCYQEQAGWVQECLWKWAGVVQECLHEWAGLVKSVCKSKHLLQEWEGLVKNVWRSMQNWSMVLQEQEGLVKIVYEGGWDWSRVYAGVSKTGQPFCRSRQDWLGVFMGVGGCVWRSAGAGNLVNFL